MYNPGVETISEDRRLACINRHKRKTERYFKEVQVILFI